MRRARIFPSAAAVLLRCQKTSFLVVMIGLMLMMMPVSFSNAESDLRNISKILSTAEPRPSIRRIDEDLTTAGGDTGGEETTAPADNESNGQEPNESNDTIDTTDEVPVPTGTDEASPTNADAAPAETPKSPGDLQTDTTDTGGGEEEGATPEPTPAPVTAPVADDNNSSSSAPTTSKGGAETATESPKEENDPGVGGGGEEDGGAEEKITSNPTQAPTENELTRAPVLSPVDPPVPNDDDPDGGDQDPCGDATTCELCTEHANQLDSQEWTCWWTDDARCVKMTKEAHEYDERCPEEIPPPVGKPTGGDNNYAWDDDNESMMPLLLGLVGIAIVVLLLYRKLCSSQILAGGHAISEHGKYQGLSTAEKDEDEEWGWDDEPQSRRSRQVEMVQTTPRSSGKGSAYHRRSRSPNSATERVAESSFESSAPPLKRGLAVKRSGGLKNPLHAKQQQQQESTTPAPPPPASPPKPVRPAAPVVKKQAVQADDFFEDFGFAASSAAGRAKSKSSAAAVSKPPSAGLGATRLTTENAAGKDDWGDDDLDDLLDD